MLLDDYQDEAIGEEREDCGMKYVTFCLLQNAALRTTLEVCMSVRPSLLAFFPIYSKNLEATHTSKFVTLCNIFMRMPL